MWARAAPEVAARGGAALPLSPTSEFTTQAKRHREHGGEWCAASCRSPRGSAWFVLLRAGPADEQRPIARGGLEDRRGPSRAGRGAPAARVAVDSLAAAVPARAPRARGR